MEGETELASTLWSRPQIPIAQLDPSLPNLSESCVKAVVTIIWPYSSSNKTLTVLLAEPDFRLRRSRGQVRVQFLGAIAKSVNGASIGSGDEVFLGLDGVEWVRDTSNPAQPPGRGIEWELRFSQKLSLQVRENTLEMAVSN
jgi:hypothetical protein